MGSGAVAARAAAVLAVLLCLATLVGGCGSDRRQVKLIYAGSLIVPFDRLAAAFEKEHPDVDVVTEAHGSIQVLRHVTELGDRMDFVASADEQLIPPLLYDRERPGDQASHGRTGIARSPPIAWCWRCRPGARWPAS